MKHSNWTGRIPRTLNDAFSPYANELAPLRDHDPLHRVDAVSLWVYCGIAAAVVLLILFGVIR